VFVNQTNLNGKLRKKLGGQPKIGGGMAHPVPLSLVLINVNILFRLGCRWPANLLQATWCMTILRLRWNYWVLTNQLRWFFHVQCQYVSCSN